MRRLKSKLLNEQCPAGIEEETTACHYKVLTKVLANCLKHIIPEVISEEKNCSIPNRAKFNNISLVRDLIKCTNLYLFQINQEKVFHKTDRTFLLKTTEKLGISQIFVNFARILYENNASIIINNGFLSPQVTLSRGLRQGLLLYLPLQVIQGEVATSNSNTNRLMTGIQIPNKTKQTKMQIILICRWH